MPFKAKNIETGENIYITSYVKPKIELMHTQLVCPYCESDMIVKGGIGRKVISHFCHKTTCTANIDYKPGGQGESVNHQISKKYIYGQLTEQNKASIEAGEHRYEYEYSVKDNDVWRIADIAEILSDGTFATAYEIQLSYIQLEELERRTNDYTRLGAETVWIFGGSANTTENRDWCIDNIGIYGVVKIGTKDVTSTRALKSVSI